MAHIDVPRLSWQLDRRSLTWDDLSQRSGIPYSTLWAIRRGRPCRRQTVARIAAVLDEAPVVEAVDRLLVAPAAVAGQPS